MIHYVEQLARKAVIINSIRKHKKQLEMQVRQLQDANIMELLEISVTLLRLLSVLLCLVTTLKLLFYSLYSPVFLAVKIIPSYLFGKPRPH